VLIAAGVAGAGAALAALPSLITVVRIVGATALLGYGLARGAAGAPPAGARHAAPGGRRGRPGAGSSPSS
jgi:arginine exporter protein ArgO